MSTSPDFAAKWLVNRLGRFAESHAEIDLRVSATMHQVDFVREDVDLAVRHGDGKWPGLDVVRLCSERLFPVCSPQLLSGPQRITADRDLLKFPLLRLDDSAWTRWFEAAGVADPIARGPVFNHASMLIDAAVDGQGIGLARTALAAWDMINGRLIKPIDVALDAQHLLDRLSEGGVERAEDYDVSEMAAGRSGGRRPPPGRTQCRMSGVSRMSFNSSQQSGGFVCVSTRPSR